ncbi:hypothetical protein Pan258_11720 [Symmachiella dynata]|nr:hypothetical protein Pan258_11720 [Symmachiella dynata]
MNRFGCPYISQEGAPTKIPSGRCLTHVRNTDNGAKNL